MRGDHLLNLTFGRWGTEWSLTCHHADGAYPTIDIETGTEDPECWTVDWFDNCDIDELLAPSRWPETLAFPLPVRPVWDEGLTLEYDVEATR